MKTCNVCYFGCTCCHADQTGLIYILDEKLPRVLDLKLRKIRAWVLVRGKSILFPVDLTRCFQVYKILTEEICGVENIVESSTSQFLGD